MKRIAELRLCRRAFVNVSLVSAVRLQSLAYTALRTLTKGLVVYGMFASGNVGVAEIVEMYARLSKQGLIQNRFIYGELDEDSVVRKFRTTAADGKSYFVALPLCI